MSRGTLPEVRDGLRYSPGGLGWVIGPTQRFGMGWWTFTEVQDGSGDTRGGPRRFGDPPGGLGRVGGPFQRSGTGRSTLPEVRYVSENPPGGARRVRGPTRKSGMGRRTLPEVRDGSGTHPVVEDWLGDLPRGSGQVV